MKLSRVLVLLACGVAQPASAQADAWWHHITVLAADSMPGRETGSVGDRQAVNYIADQLTRAGLTPAGTKGYLQPVQFESRRVDEGKSSASCRRCPSPIRP